MTCYSSIRARGYTSAEIADDIDTVRVKLGIRRLDLFGESYGTYLMTVYAQRHPERVRSLVLSSAYPLAMDMWGRPNARAARRTLQLLCQRSAGACNGDHVLHDIAQLSQQLRSVLVTSGDLDANTPTEAGRQAARQFRRAPVLEVPNVGHVAEHEPSGCVAAIQTAFIRDLRTPDTSCLTQNPTRPRTPLMTRSEPAR
ncbi:alpha/beta fold hydrolase [Actinomadura opuntiae]|uniref:alpha/beta fold hydrolase n=1 Tax=Actinomadura sp. OS1-43 TaxID=604315 RepID=UPI00255AAC43|nr:alpha/beta fold hydrolase [Actinomadura sp. OS1-43]MDL4816734.1 alpha/beta fold hydrolase [Actinomadura sp. OS1-43]